MAKCKSFLQIITSELEYGLHRANVATGELASAKAVSEGTAFFLFVQENNGIICILEVFFMKFLEL